MEPKNKRDQIDWTPSDVLSESEQKIALHLLAYDHRPWREWSQAEQEIYARYVGHKLVEEMLEESGSFTPAEIEKAEDDWDRWTGKGSKRSIFYKLGKWIGRFK